MWSQKKIGKEQNGSFQKIEVKTSGPTQVHSTTTSTQANPYRQEGKVEKEKYIEWFINSIIPKLK